MKILLAEHFGMCFGVRDAIAQAEQLAREGPLTILGELVHNTCPLVHYAHEQLRRLVVAGFFPIVIGKRGHVEVNGLVGDFPEAVS